MEYGFDTECKEYATASLLIYVIYRSRNKKRFKITPDLWNQIERFTKAAAKRSDNLFEFMDKLKSKVMCESIIPKVMEVGMTGIIPLAQAEDGAYIQIELKGEIREFLTASLKNVNHKSILNKIKRETTYIILLVRDRLEREKPVENRFETVIDQIFEKMEAENGK